MDSNSSKNNSSKSPYEILGVKEGAAFEDIQKARDIKTFKDMKNKIVAKVDKLDLSEKPSEESFGITDDMDDKQKCRILRKEYTKWNSQTTQKDPKRKKRAKEMVKIIAGLRKQYNC